jgi:hypothetical protein
MQLLLLLLLSCSPPFEFAHPLFEMAHELPQSPPAKVPEPEDDYIVMFTAPWCGLCQTTTTPAELTKLGYRVQKINVDENLDAKRRYNVTGLPSYAVIHGRKQVQLGRTIRGVTQTATIVKYAESFVYTSKSGSHLNQASLVRHLTKDHGFSEAELKHLTASQLDVLHDRDHDRKQPPPTK